MARHENADLEQHTDDELREGLEKAEEQKPRVEGENSREALEANRRQRDAIAAELDEREA